MIPVKLTDHVARGLAKLTDQFRGRPVIEAILSSYLHQIQLLEDATWKVIECRILSADTVGDQLDQIGKLVGEAREGRSDADYFPAIALRIKINRSDGRAEDILQVAALKILDVAAFEYSEGYPAGWMISTFGITTSLAKALLKMLGQAKSLATMGHLHFSVTPDINDDFIWDSTDASVTAGSGFSDYISELPASSLTSAQEIDA